MNSTNIGNKVFSQSSKQYWQAWIIALFWNILVWYAIVMAGENILKSFDSNPIFMFLSAFLL